MLKRVVITGIGCISPNGVGKDNFFTALLQGKSGIRQISRFAPEALDCRIAGEVSDFDPLVWLAKKDQTHVARTVPFAIAAATEALKDAGLDTTAMSLADRRRFGVLIGSGGGSIELLETHYRNYYHAEMHRTSVYAVPSNTAGTLSSEVSMRFDLKGLSHIISTGCTSSTDAIGYAFHHIQAGRLDRALCGGVDATITPATLEGFSKMKVISCSWNHEPASGSRPFSQDRDGFVLGEGAWLFVLEDREIALARQAPIYAEIIGYGATCDAYHRVRLDESGEEPARAMTLALEEAGVPAEAVDYINLHGTSTQLNDRVETRAIRNAFGSHAQQLAASSTKSMIGHPQGASGAAGIATALCAMQTGWIAPTINLHNPDPECDLDYVPNSARRKDVEYALCNCIGFGSKNSAMLLRRGDN